ncbi:MAG TPA: hypothetical protein VNK82_04720 [Terriglobales bacterium]|nr:hypothetical protein [Terriglobales bacterium]
MNHAEALAAYIRLHTEFVLVASMEGSYGHMGATLTDAVLQAGVNYETVVRPRVERVLGTYPDATTTSSFARLIRQLGADQVLSWQGNRKLRTLQELISVLLQNGVETEDQLRIWLEKPANLERIRQIKGIKDKTAHYLQILVGAQGVAIDRHLFRFLEEAGTPTNSYDEAHKLICDAATLLGVDWSVLDYSIWRYMSQRASGVSTKHCGGQGSPPNG